MPEKIDVDLIKALRMQALSRNCWLKTIVVHILNQIKLAFSVIRSYFKPYRPITSLVCTTTTTNSQEN